MFTYAQSKVANPSEATVPMFKYVPSILDLIIQVSDHEDLISVSSPAPQPAGGDFASLSRGQSQFQAIVGPDGFFHTTALPSGGVLSSPPTPYETGLLGYGAADPNGEVTVGGSPVGYAYGLSGPVTVSSGPESQGSPGNLYVKPLRISPFSPGLISADGQNYLFGQPVVDRLAIMDLLLKYGTVNPWGGTAPTPNGIPQFYEYAGGDSFSLFGSESPANVYFQTSAGSQIVALLDPTTSNPYPNVLLFNPVTGFSSSMFSISSVGNNVYNLPQGHIVVYTKLGQSLGIATFFILGGGQYNISYSVSTAGASLVITGISGATVSRDDAPTTSSAQVTSAQQAINTKGATNTVSIGIKPNDYIVMISPAFEPTVEHMLQYGSIPTSQVGFRAPAESASVQATATIPTLASNDHHANGWAVDLSVDAYLVSFTSDVKLVGTTSSSLSAVNRIMAVAQTAGFTAVSGGSQTSIPGSRTNPIDGVTGLGVGTPPKFIPGAYTFNPSYPNGTAMIPQVTSVIHLELSALEIMGPNLNPNSPAGVVALLSAERGMFTNNYNHIVRG